VIRQAKNIRLDCVCPNCERRLWYTTGERSSSRRYFAPKWFRDLFIQALGRYNLGSYYLDKCEVCDRTVAVFDDNTGQFYGEVVVLYACTLLAVPLENDEVASCAEQKSCYGCPLKSEDEYVKRQ
jgi:uncharacterized protein YlaI